MSPRATHTSTVIARQIAAVEKFLSGFNSALDLTEIVGETVGGSRAVRMARDGCDEALKDSLDHLGELAGRALSATEGRRIGSGSHGHKWDPLQHWRDPFRPGGGFSTPDEIVEVCNTLIGQLQYELDEAKADEATLAHRIARVVGFPATVRDATISAGHGPRAARGAFWTTIGAPIVVGIIVTVISAWAIARVV